MAEDTESIIVKLSECSFCHKTQKDNVTIVSGPNVFICNECVDLCKEVIEEDIEAQAQSNLLTKLPLPAEIKTFLDQYVIGQEVPKRILAVAVYNHYKRIRYSQETDEKDEVELSKSNILLIGPTGSGKTLLAQTLARTLNVPFIMADATTLTEAGYVGEDVENIIQKLLQNCNFEVERAQRAIVYIDEIDKIARKSDNPSVTRDVSGEGVQQALLKLIEGTITSVSSQGHRRHPNQDGVRVDTSNILFIVGGAFDGLDKIIRNRTEKSGIGFSASVRAKSEVGVGQLYAEVEPEDLIKFGLIPELVGRLPIVATLSELDEDALVQILLEPKNALVKQFHKLFSIEGAELEINLGALRAIARKALKRKTGARGLRSIVESSLLDVMYELPSQGNVQKVVLDENVIEGKSRPLLIFAESETRSIIPVTNSETHPAVA